MEPLQPPAAQPTGPARLSRLQKKVWFLSGMGVFLDGFDLFIIGVALPLIAEQFMLGGAEQGIVGAAAVLGAVLGAAALGRMADRFGRRRLFMVDLSLFVIFAVASALSWGLWSLVAFRFLLGFAVGADYPIASTYLAEFMPTRVRGRWTVGAFSFQAIGMLTGAGLGVAILLSGVDQDLAWRLARYPQTSPTKSRGPRIVVVKERRPVVALQKLLAPMRTTNEPSDVFVTNL